MSKLSPAAQAVLDAFTNDCLDNHHSTDALAAALRTAADQVVPLDPCGYDCCITVCEEIRSAFLAIADELEAGND
jgi:hypothetical protein